MYTVLALLLMGAKFHELGSWTENSTFSFFNHGFTDYISCIHMYVCVCNVCTSYMYSIILLQVICKGAERFVGYTIYANTEPFVKLTKL